MDGSNVQKVKCEGSSKKIYHIFILMQRIISHTCAKAPAPLQSTKLAAFILWFYSQKSYNCEPLKQQQMKISETFFAKFDQIYNFS